MTLLERLQSGEFKEYRMTSRPIYGNSEIIELNINISYTDIFKKYKGNLIVYAFAHRNPL